MARPKKDPEERRDAPYPIRFTPAERAALERSAAAHGITLAEFVRRRSLGYRLPPLAPEHQAIASLAAALIPIGNNLNQLARAANAGRLLPHSVEQLAGEIRTLLEGLYGSGADGRRAQL